MSARNYYSAYALREDAKRNRRIELELRVRHRSELNPSDQLLRDANTAKLRAEASETILRTK